MEVGAFPPYGILRMVTHVDHSIGGDAEERGPLVDLLDLVRAVRREPQGLELAEGALQGCAVLGDQVVAGAQVLHFAGQNPQGVLQLRLVRLRHRLIAGVVCRLEGMGSVGLSHHARSWWWGCQEGHGRIPKSPRAPKHSLCMPGCWGHTCMDTAIPFQTFLLEMLGCCPGHWGPALGPMGHWDPALGALGSCALWGWDPALGLLPPVWHGIPPWGHRSYPVHC